MQKLLLALLVCHGAGSFASRLAGGLALAAAALDSGFFQIGFVESLDMLLHGCTSNRSTNKDIIANKFLYFNL